jgi:hypothetical protein
MYNIGHDKRGGKEGKSTIEYFKNVWLYSPCLPRQGYCVYIHYRV